MEEIGQRLKLIRREKHLTQEGMGKVLGVSKQAVANIEGGYNNPSIDFIGKLIQNFSVNANWFITGEGEMFNAPKYEDVKDEILAEVDSVLAKYGIKKL